MGQRISCVKKAVDSNCVYNSHLSTPLQSTANTPNPHQREERRAGTAEEDEGERKVREKKRVMRKKGRFWRRLACFHFSRPRAGQDRKAQNEKVEQSEKLEQAGYSRCSTDVFPSLDQVSLQHITCTAEDCDHQEAPSSSSDILSSSEDQQMQEQPQSCVDDSPVNLSEGEIVSPLTEQQDNDVVTSFENICLNYNIGAKLGEGGFGAVFEGVQRKDDLPVALKFARKTENMEYINIPDHAKPVPLEIGLTVLANKGPSSPHIIELLDWQELPNHYVMVLQHPLPCENLSVFLECCGGIFDEEFARHVMQQVIEAAVKCCSRGVLHRDIKLENLLVNTDTLDVTLFDFGCGDLLHEMPYNTFSGTRKYCPPEYLETGKYNGRQATVFSLGVVLYTLVCGYYPDHTDLDKIKDWLWYLPSLSKECSHLINDCLHPNPEERIPLDRLLLHDWFKMFHLLYMSSHKSWRQEHLATAIQELLFSQLSVCHTSARFQSWPSQRVCYGYPKLPVKDAAEVP
ncbi:serine/threonine-protein kinase pim-1-like [Sinocyclocheilus rhinocerous]|uniref:serine/threonine-protein kinase pim-1-like n=1 Tax=Sinocyclocheilus rhinocerous TaxID=307959 RepID=UPI0007B9ECC4|nr:PREDICTED: serine/threonine-protein kinase pim-1-like [Sinocyclocheilus rhinocerous]